MYLGLLTIMVEVGGVVRPSSVVAPDQQAGTDQAARGKGWARAVMSLRDRTLAVVSVAPLLLVLATTGLNSASVLASEDRLETGTVKFRTLAEEREFDGAVEAVMRSTISAQTAGEVIELPFDVNDFVPKGALIVRFDDVKQKARLDKAVAIEAEARARLAEAEEAFERENNLLQQGATSKAKHEAASANLKSTRAKLRLAEAAVAEARKEYEHTVVRAPYSGIVVERFVEIGEQLQIGQPLGTGLSLEELRIAVEVPARYIDRVRQRQEARIVLPGEANAPVPIESLTIFPYADPKTHTFTVRVNLARGDHGLYPGMLAKVAFTVGAVEELVVPTQAIVRRSELTGIYVVTADGRIVFRQIRPGRAADGWTVVLAGLDAGEEVALNPALAVIRLKQQVAGLGYE